MPPRRPVLGVLGDNRFDPIQHRCRPWPLRQIAATVPGQPVVVGPAGNFDQLGEPRNTELTIAADHLEVLDGGRYSAPFFHTRSCT